MENYNGTFSMILLGNLVPVENKDSLFNRNKSVDNVDKKTSTRLINIKRFKKPKVKISMEVEENVSNVVSKIMDKIKEGSDVFQVGIYDQYLSYTLSSKVNFLSILLDQTYNTKSLDYLSLKDNIIIYVGDIIYSLDNYYIFNDHRFDYIIIDDYRGDERAFVKIMQDIRKIVKEGGTIISIGNHKELSYYEINTIEKINVGNIIISIFNFII